MTRLSQALPPADAAGIAPTVKKLLLTSAVVLSFAAYAALERLQSPADGASSVNAGPVAANPIPASPSGDNRGAALPQTPTAPTHAPQTAAATPTHAPVVVRPTATPSPTPAPAQLTGSYKDGVYAGDSMDAYWGNVQIQAVIKGGRLADVQIVDYPNHRRTSVEINNYAMPRLQTEAIQAQVAQVNLISGATLTSEAYVRSLQSALVKAKR